MKEITLDAVVENIPVVTEFVDRELEKAGCSPRSQMQIDVAIDELFGNIAHYAYPDGNGQATVRVETEEEKGIVTLIFLDQGIAYNPLDAEEPDVTLPAEERRIGGLGIFMVKKIMDEVAYDYHEGWNMLTIRKRI